MKIRSDYVTNSSSSSFVVAYRSLPEFDQETIAKYPFLKNYGNLIEKILFTAGYNDTSEGEIYKTKEEWDKYIIDCYGWKDRNTVEKILEDEDYSTEIYNKAVQYLESGYNILDKRIDYCDSFCANMFYELGKDGENFVILEECG